MKPREQNAFFIARIGGDFVAQRFQILVAAQIDAVERLRGEVAPLRTEHAKFSGGGSGEHEGHEQFDVLDKSAMVDDGVEVDERRICARLKDCGDAADDDGAGNADEEQREKFRLRRVFQPADGNFLICWCVAHGWRFYGIFTNCPQISISTLHFHFVSKAGKQIEARNEPARHFLF